MGKPHRKTDAYTTFIASMNITVDEWRDGIGFDLDALENVTAPERDDLAKILTDRLKTKPDWREIEALAAIGTPAAKKAILGALDHADPETRLHAAEHLAEMGEPEHLESAIIQSLRTARAMEGLSKAIDMAEGHPSPSIQETLLDLALNGDEDQRIHCAALALYLGGKAEEAFDWNHRPFFLQFGDIDRRVQIQAYKELCERLGVAPKDK
jgi:HEAT repeat protein